MKTYHKTIDTYTFDELSTEAKQRAIDNEQDNCHYLNYEWWDCTESDFTTIASLMGIDIENTFFSGFSSQGDGACFTGTYAYKKGSVKEVKEYAPMNTELHSIARRLQETQKKYFYKLTASISHNDRYYHDQSVDIEVDHENDVKLPVTQNYRDDTGIDEALRDLMTWYYRQLEKEYDRLLSDEVIGENFIANEVEFTNDGEVYF